MLDLDGHPNPEVVLERARRVCGVASVSLGYRTSSTLSAMQSLIGRLVEGRTFASFRISARRAFKTYPMSSVELNRALATGIRKAQDPIMMGKAAVGLIPSKLTMIMQGA